MPEHGSTMYIRVQKKKDLLAYLYKYLFMQPIKAKREFFNPLILLVSVAKFFLGSYHIVLCANFFLQGNISKPVQSNSDMTTINL